MKNFGIKKTVKGQANPWMWVAILMALVLAVGGLAAYWTVSHSASVAGGNSPSQPQYASGSSGGVLSQSQVIKLATTDAQKPTTAVSSGLVSTVFTGGAFGPGVPILSPGGLTTPGPGTTVSIFSSATNYFGSAKMYIVQTNGQLSAATQTYTTPAIVNPAINQYMKAVDTPTLTATVDGTTANGVYPNNQNISTGGCTALNMKVQQGAAYKSLSGEDGTFIATLNVTTPSTWDTTRMSASWDGSQCSAYAGRALNFTNGQYLTAYNCTGDFAPGGDSTIHHLITTLCATSGVTPASQNVTVQIVPNDWYNNTISGNLGYGPVKNDGTVIQQFRDAKWYVG